MTEGNGNLVQLTSKDFKSDQEVRWCPGCGDYAILNVIQGFMPELGLSRERIVFVSGIGCAARFPYYMQTYGMHSIHGRAPAIATGLAVTRPDLSVWVVTGDGDALSIGGNHLIHSLRRNVNLKILLFNNEIYGLTKGQYSPTSRVGKVTKSTPMGSLDYPFNPLSIAIGAEASFVARAIDTDKKGLTEVLGAAARHRGSAFVEILQNCNIYNDGAFDFVREEKENRIYLQSGERIRFGAEGEKGVQQYPDGSLRVVDVAEAGENSLLVHDAAHAQASLAFALSRITFETHGAVPLGVFRVARAAGLRRPDGRAARGRARAAGRGRPRRRSCTRATPGPSAPDARPPAHDQPADELPPVAEAVGAGAKPEAPPRGAREGLARSAGRLPPRRDGSRASAERSVTATTYRPGEMRRGTSDTRDWPSPSLSGVRGVGTGFGFGAGAATANRPFIVSKCGEQAKTHSPGASSTVDVHVSDELDLRRNRPATGRLVPEDEVVLVREIVDEDGVASGCESADVGAGRVGEPDRESRARRCRRAASAAPGRPRRGRARALRGGATGGEPSCRVRVAARVSTGQLIR